MSKAWDQLLPRPRRIETLDGRLPWRGSLSLFLDSGVDIEESLRLDALTDRLFAPWMRAVSEATVEAIASLDPAWRPGGVRLSPALVAEAYGIDIDEGGIRLIAASPAGLRHAFQTLRQLLEDGDDAGSLPRIRLMDWPRVPTRGMHVDLAREMEYRPAHLKRVIENLASFKGNTLHLYLENKFAYPSAPEIVPPRVMTPAQARELCEFAAIYGVTLIPQIPTMGHMEHFLHGPYAEMREDPGNPYNLCPTHPRARPFLAGLIADVAAAFKPPYIHVGYDESHSGVCPRCRAAGPAHLLLADHLNWLNGEVKKHHARTMIYGDKFLSRAAFPQLDAANGGKPEEAEAALAKVDRDILITDWHYTAPYAGTTAHLVKKGFEVHMASASNIYWHDSIPLNRGHLWVVETQENALRAGATGAINTNWEYYRGQFLDNYWTFQALTCERGWTDEPHDYPAWGRRFARRFWGVEEDGYSDVAGLAESAPTGRRPYFLDSALFFDERPGYPLSLFQITLDYEGIGESIIRRAGQFKKAARRNADTLRLLDMPGWIILYHGVRVSRKGRLQEALRKGDKAAALAAVRDVQDVLAGVMGRLKEGYKAYGGAGVDLQRAAVHRDYLLGLEARLRKLPAKALPALTLDAVSAQINREAPAAGRGFIRSWQATALVRAPASIRSVKPPPALLTFVPVSVQEEIGLADIRRMHQGADGLLYVKGEVVLKSGGRGRLLFGADGPVKVWVNGKAVACEPAATNPAVGDGYACPAAWKKGLNTVLFALATNGGRAWGVIARPECLPPGKRKAP
jgi:hypothetical protein